MKLKLLLLAVASVLLTSCGHLAIAQPAKPGSSTTNPCTAGGPCEVLVTPTAGQPCTVTVDLPTVNVRSGNAAVRIRWALPQGSTFAFMQGGGVLFNKAPTPGTREKWAKPGLLQPQPAASPQEVVLLDNHGDSGSGGIYKYTVYVIDSNGVPCKALDPDVDNN